MSTELQATTGAPPPPPPPAIEGTPHERREAIHAGMRARLDEVIAEHPHIRYALGMDTPEIREANTRLAAAVNNFISGNFPLRQQVRPYFERAVAVYLKTADEIVAVLSAVIVVALNHALGEHPYIDLSLETERISECAARFSAERRRMLRGDVDPELLCRSFYELVAAYADAATPADLPVEPSDDDARGPPQNGP